MRVCFRRYSFVLLMSLLGSACQPVLEPAIPTRTIQPVVLVPSTVATVTPTATPTATQSPTIPPEATSTILVNTSVQQKGFQFIQETIPDGSNFSPGEEFHKSWTIQNGGEQTWTTDYHLELSASTPSGENLDSPAEISLAREVLPGEKVELGVDLTAPEQTGRYVVYYQLMDGFGKALADSQVWVSITVGNLASPSLGGVTAQLVNASMQGGEFTVNFCTQLPDTRAWYPWAVTLQANNQTYSPSGSRSDMATALTANKCFGFSFPIELSSGTAYQLSIGKVELPPEVHQAENCASAQATLRSAYPGLDFKCSGAGSFYSGLVLPADMSTEKANQLILDAMSSAIYGPWVLSGTS
jgi:hypothetical protein